MSSIVLVFLYIWNFHQRRGKFEEKKEFVLDFFQMFHHPLEIRNISSSPNHNVISKRFNSFLSSKPSQWTVGRKSICGHCNTISISDRKYWSSRYNWISLSFKCLVQLQNKELIVSFHYCVCLIGVVEIELEGRVRNEASIFSISE